MRILAEIHPPDTTRAILVCLKLPSRAPPTAAAAPNPDAETETFSHLGFEFDFAGMCWRAAARDHDRLPSRSRRMGTHASRTGARPAAKRGTA